MKVRRTLHVPGMNARPIEQHSIVRDILIRVRDKPAESPVLKFGNRFATSTRVPEKGGSIRERNGQPADSARAVVRSFGRPQIHRRAITTGTPLSGLNVMLARGLIVTPSRTPNRNRWASIARINVVSIIANAAPMLQLLEALAAQAPLVVVLDDLHWATPAFLDLVQRLERMKGSVLLLGLTRPDDSTPAAGADVLQLEPLADSDVARLVIGRGGPVTPVALHRIVDLAQGNPLYAQQLLAESDEAELDTIPASLVGLLSMRLDRLGPGERDVLRCAAVGGLDVDLGAVGDLLPPEAGPFIATHLETLVRKRFLDRVSGGGLRFAHVLLQMAAYQSLTTQDRMRLQAAFEARAARQSAPAMDLSK